MEHARRAEVIAGFAAGGPDFFFKLPSGAVYAVGCTPAALEAPNGTAFARHLPILILVFAFLAVGATGLTV
jgi:hypothetical protein